MKQKSVFWIALFAVLAAAGIGLYLLRGGGEAELATVYVDGKPVETIDLASVVFPYERTIETEYGYKTLRIRHGAIEVAEADCSEQVCVRQGAISDSLIPIVCLPHHLVIEIEETP